MLKQIVTIVITGIVLVGLDSIYLSVIKNAFELQIRSIQNSPMTINIVGAILCYIILTLGVYYFVIREHRSSIDSFLLGSFVYGVYETTNYSVFKKWKEEIMVIDTLWGGTLFVLTKQIVDVISGAIKI